MASASIAPRVQKIIVEKLQSNAETLQEFDQILLTIEPEVMPSHANPQLAIAASYVKPVDGTEQFGQVLLGDFSEDYSSNLFLQEKCGLAYGFFHLHKTQSGLDCRLKVCSVNVIPDLSGISPSRAARIGVGTACFQFILRSARPPVKISCSEPD